MTGVALIVQLRLQDGAWRDQASVQPPDTMEGLAQARRLWAQLDESYPGRARIVRRSTVDEEIEPRPGVAR